MKLYLNIDQARLVRNGLYAQERDLKAALEKGVSGPVKEASEEGLQEVKRLVSFLNEEIARAES